MPNQFSRIQLLFGAPAMERPKASRVAISGLGGVGNYIVEALARSGVGALDLIDDDKVCLTNLSRRIPALRSIVGKYKVEVAAARMAEINPDCRVTVHRMFYLPETADYFDFRDYDYVVDAIDIVTSRTQLTSQAREANTKIISCMGAGNKLDLAKLVIADIYKTSVDPLTRAMRRELKKRGVRECKAVYSTGASVRPLEDPSISCRNHCVCPPGTERKCIERRDVPGSTAFVPAVVGLILAGEVVHELAEKREAQVSFGFAREKS